MKNTIKSLLSIISLLLVISMMLSLICVNIMADEVIGEDPLGEDIVDEPVEEGTGEEGGEEVPEELEDIIPDYAAFTHAYNSAEEKLQSIKDGIESGKNISISKFGSTLYCDAFSGEIVWVNDTTGEMLFTNPYDVATTGAASNMNTRYELLSQVIINYSQNGKAQTMTSYKDACQREQITAKYIKNGIRVEYAIGKLEARKLVPRRMSKTRFEHIILNKVETERDREKLLAYYMIQDQNDETKTAAQKQEMLAMYPVTKKMAIYVFDTGASERELNEIEAIIKKWAPEYTYDDLNEDHSMTEYEGNDAAPALFRLALEYTLAEDGSMGVRLAASGIRFDETNYQLNSVAILPFFSASRSEFGGFTFIPDGSGAVLLNEDLKNTTYTISGKVYGVDFAYHEITGANQEVMRMPVFGVVEDWIGYMEVTKTTESGFEMKETVPSGETEKRGYFAVIEEGDAVATITSTHGGGVVHKYNSVYTSFIPRATDTYDLSGSLSVGDNNSYTVTSKRKYTGNYSIRYYMLADEQYKSKLGDDYYEASYIGMAKKYRDYLEKKGIIERKSADENKTDIPLYIESLGDMDSVEQIVSVPINVKTALTTFDDIKKMYTELKEQNITNLSFKLTGFTNGGLYATAPYNVKFENKLGGNNGFKDLVSYADENGFKVYPDFDFLYVNKTSLFDGINLRYQAVRTIDNRYTQKRVYDPINRNFIPSGLVALSAPSISDIFDHFVGQYEQFGNKSISMSTIGSDLNSDFDRKDPYDRNDSKVYIENILTKSDELYDNIMVDGANYYSIKYATDVLNTSLDSSRYASASYSIPFFSMVYHGYKNYAGKPTNMASDSRYELLKMVESGADPYFLLAYENLSKLKENTKYNKYYSVSFDIWKEDLIETYNTLNSNFKTLQSETIENHEYIKGSRILTEEEKAEIEAKEQEKKALEAETERQKKEAEELADKRQAWLLQKFGIQPKEQEVLIGGVNILENFKNQQAQKATSSTGDASTTDIDLGTIVRVTYSDGSVFYINYNEYAVETEDGVTLEAYSFIKK